VSAVRLCGRNEIADLSQRRRIRFSKIDVVIFEFHIDGLACKISGAGTPDIAIPFGNITVLWLVMAAPKRELPVESAAPNLPICGCLRPKQPKHA
jgi:hypothetical protein